MTLPAASPREGCDCSASWDRSPSERRQLRIERVNVGRQSTLLPEVVPDVFECGQHMPAIDAHDVGKRVDEAFGVRLAVVIVDPLVGDQTLVLPDGNAILPPPARKRPPG